VGDVNNIIYRSSWEKRVCQFFDESSGVLYWNSENMVIPYFYTVDGKMHNYHIDFMVKIQSRSGEVKTYLTEVKPYKETIPPSTKNKKRLLIETQTYIKNQCKWAAARSFAESKGITFILLNEFDIGIKKRTK
jgi:hypothetical protein